MASACEDEDKNFCTVLDFVGTHRKEFRFDRRYRALLGGARRDIERSVQCDVYQRREWLADLVTRLTALLRHLAVSGVEPSKFAVLQTLVSVIEAGGDVDPIWVQTVTVLEAFATGS